MNGSIKSLDFSIIFGLLPPRLINKNGPSLGQRSAMVLVKWWVECAQVLVINRYGNQVSEYELLGTADEGTE